MIDVSAEHARLVKAILRRHLPGGAQVWVFGSRANGTPKPFSDLDLAVDAARPLTLDELGSIKEAFTESALPWKVDIVDMHMVDNDFRPIIERQKIALDYT